MFNIRVKRLFSYRIVQVILVIAILFTLFFVTNITTNDRTASSALLEENERNLVDVNDNLAQIEAVLSNPNKPFTKQERQVMKNAFTFFKWEEEIYEQNIRNIQKRGPAFFLDKQSSKRYWENLATVRLYNIELYSYRDKDVQTLFKENMAAQKLLKKPVPFDASLLPLFLKENAPYKFYLDTYMLAYLTIDLLAHPRTLLPVGMDIVTYLQMDNMTLLPILALIACVVVGIKDRLSGGHRLLAVQSMKPKQWFRLYHREWLIFFGSLIVCMVIAISVVSMFLGEGLDIQAKYPVIWPHYFDFVQFPDHKSAFDIYGYLGETVFPTKINQVVFLPMGLLLLLSFVITTLQYIFYIKVGTWLAYLPKHRWVSYLGTALCVFLHFSRIAPMFNPFSIEGGLASATAFTNQSYLVSILLLVLGLLIGKGLETKLTKRDMVNL